MRSRPPAGMAWHALSARFCSACWSIAGSARSIGRSGGQSTWTSTPVFLASAPTMGMMASIIDASAAGWSFSSSGRVNLSRPCSMSSRRLSVLAITAMCSFAASASTGLARAPLVADLVLHELEVDDHRVQRVLDLVGDAGRQAAERRELVRVPERRLHLAQVAEVPAHQHHADDLP